MNRFQNQIESINNNTKNPKLQKSPDDIVIVSAKRTAVCKAKRGGFNATTAATLLSAALKAVVDHSKIDPKLVSDIVVGTVLANGTLRHVEARMAGFTAGFPESTSVKTVNRQCSSGLEAIASVAAAIRMGYYEIGIAAGVESMTLDSNFKWTAPIMDEIPKNKNARDCLIPMGITSENVAEKFKLERSDIDKLSLMSHQRAFKARKKFAEEIIPVTTKKRDIKTNELKQVTVDFDDGVREKISLEALSKLKPSFKKGGSTTAGNSSQVSDGAAAALIMTRKKSEELNLAIMGVLRGHATAGVAPEIMGVGPLFAVPKVLRQVGIEKEDVDLFEINEAFATQALYCVRELGISWDKVNVNGGAIAIGHPLGCTGVRMTVTLLNEMRRRKSKLGVVSMCIGTGMGAAAVFSSE